jgi:hypothetical protein
VVVVIVAGSEDVEASEEVPEVVAVASSNHTALRIKSTVCLPTNRDLESA